VGGWIAQNGYGIGSLKYGGIGENIEWLEVADFEGIKQIAGDRIRYYVGAFGTTGIILRASIKLRDNVKIRCSAFECSFEEAIGQISGAYHASFKDGNYMVLKGFDNTDILFVSYEGEGEDSELGKILWEKRFYPLKALKPDKIYSEVVVPTDEAVKFYNQVKELPYGIEAIFTRNLVLFLGLFGRGLRQYMKALKFVKVAEKFGGGIYTTGLLFPHKHRARREFLDYKRKVDPMNLLNPKKAFQNNVFSRILRIGERFLWAL
ncbi:MAG: hypothetical protein N3D09_02095, partial [Archaeoglobaceae archaeon]|nr:hypothetical protein [Archaeoglobaceae archaeon]